MSHVVQCRAREEAEMRSNWQLTGTYTMNNGDAPLSTGKNTTLKTKTFKFGATSIIYETKKLEQVNSPSPDSGFPEN